MVVELKSLDKDQFKKLAQPYSEHRIRTALYLHLIHDSESPWRHQIDLSQARVVYMTKGFGTNCNTPTTEITPLKEYVIDPLTVDVAPYLKKAYITHRYRTHGGALPDGVCPTALCERAKKCGVRKECFSPKYQGYVKP